MTLVRGLVNSDTFLFSWLYVTLTPYIAFFLYNYLRAYRLLQPFYPNKQEALYCLRGIASFPNEQALLAWLAQNFPNNVRLKVAARRHCRLVRLAWIPRFSLMALYGLRLLLR